MDKLGQYWALLMTAAAGLGWAAGFAYADANFDARGDGPSDPDESPWSFVRELEDGVRVYQRPTASGVPEARAVLDTDIPLEDLREVITDYEHFSEFFPHMESSVIEDADPTRPVVRQRLRFPLLLAAREYLIQVDIMSDANGDTKRDTKRDTGGEVRQWLVSWRQIRLPQLPVDAVEPIDLHGSWRLSVRCKITRSISHLGMRDRWYSSTRRGTSVVRCSRVQARDRRFADPWDKCPHRYGS